MSVIELKNVFKQYNIKRRRTVDALSGVNLNISAGEFTAIVGASGAGKTTLLNLIGCFDKPSSGQIIIDGLDCSSLNDKELSFIRNKKLGFIFQQFNLISAMTVFENIELPLLLDNTLSKHERSDKIFKSLNEVGLEKYANHKPNQLSGGQQQRVAIARALINNPALIIADEPTASLDAKTAHVILDVMHELNRIHGTTFLISTHDEKLMGRVNRIVKIQAGKISNEQ